jgi:tetratricopeptide (TPR) repeat protein
MVFVVDDLGTWLVALLADAGRKRLTTVILGSDQERALRRAAKAAAESTAGELCPGDDERAGQLMMVIGEVFRTPAPDIAVTGQVTVLEALQAGVAGQLAPLADADLTGVGISSAAALGVPPAVLARTLTSHLVREIVVRGARGGPLAPLAVQMNFDVTHLRAQRIEDILGQLDSEVRHALARLDKPVAIAAVPTALDQLPPPVAGFTGRDRELAVLSDLLNPAGSSGAAVSVVAGLAGIGKTTLAVAAGHAALAEAVADAPGRWRMHDLLRLYAERISDVYAEAYDREQALNELLVYYLETANEHCKDLPRKAQRSDPALQDNALAWLDAERPSLIPAVALAAETGRDEIARTLPLVLAPYLDWRRRFEDGLATLTIGLGIARRRDERSVEASTLTVLSLAQRQLRRFDDAVATATEAVAICREIGDRREEGIALLHLGMALADSRRFKKAIAAYRDAGAAFRETGDWRNEAMVLGNLGLDLTQLRRFEEAILAHRQAAVIYRASGDRHGESTALGNLSLALRETGQDEEAIAACQEALSISREISDRHGEATELCNLGNALLMSGRFAEAITAHQEAAEIFRETGDRNREGEELTNLGSALLDAGRADEALTAHQDALAVFRETGDQHGEAGALNNLGLALSEVGRFEDAISAYRESAAAFRRTGDRHRERIALANLEATISAAGK